MNINDVLAYHTGTYAMPDQIISNEGYVSGSGYAGDDASGTGRVSLGMLSIAIIGVMFFYVATRGRQL